MVNGLQVRIFADGANKAEILKYYAKPWISGFTTNPTLMRRAGVADYEAFARDILEVIPDRPFSLEVLADEFSEMERQARVIASWGENVYVKIPVTNTHREPSFDLIRRLSRSGVKVNVTALMTLPQVRDVSRALSGGAPSFVSLFAGRIADAGIDPVPVMTTAIEILGSHGNTELIWASPREILNLVQADRIGCHIITLTSDLLKKLDLLGKDLADYSLETVQMFYADAVKSGLSI